MKLELPAAIAWPTSAQAACCPTREPMLCAHEVAVSYAGIPAVSGVTLPIHRGCITAIMGPSGCGKSSFLASLNRMTDLVDGCRVGGRVLFDGQDIRAAGTDVVALRRRIGMIFQRPNPFPMSIAGNITFPLRQHGLRHRGECADRAEQALRRVGLWNEVADRLDAPALALSGGQQQRLCLARALALEPEVMLLDEPCSALDPVASGVVEDLVASLRGRYTTVVVTHNLGQARRIADDVAMFWTEGGVGTLVEHGPARDVFASPQHAITAAFLSGERG
jgi:phosphate transport system ATP-binding protein